MLPWGFPRVGKMKKASGYISYRGRSEVNYLRGQRSEAVQARIQSL